VAFTDDQLGFQATVRELLARECRVRAAWDGDAPFAVWPALAKAGVVGMTAPERFGGLGLDACDLVLVLEESGRAALPEPLTEHTAVAIPLLSEVATPALADRWIGAAAAGRAMITVGFTSAAFAGSPFVVEAARANLILVERDGELHAIERSAAILEPVESVDRARKLFRVQPTSSVVVSRDAAALARAFDRGTLAASAQLVGLARAMIDRTVEYAKVRTQFGKAIGSFQAVKHHLASAHVAVELAAPCVYHAADAIATAAPDRATHVSIAKSLASDAAQTAARAALQCHGAIGYSFEYDLHLWMKRVWALAAAWGDAAWHRARVARTLLGDDHA
jgi:alkylation response protein AidB-like acyl-CoA dehydrogenase